jgi:hypothetical protein
MFKTERLEIEVTVPRIQMEFCDGQLQSQLQDDNLIPSIPAPLLQIQMKKMALRMSQRGINAEFEPTQRSTIGIPSEVSRRRSTVRQPGDGKTPLLKVHGEMEVESTYFNQTVQAFEPFIEPWSIYADVS